MAHWRGPDRCARSMAGVDNVRTTTFRPVGPVAEQGAAWLAERSLPRDRIKVDGIRGALAWAMAQPKCPQHVVKLLELLGKTEGMYKDVLLTDPIREVPDEVAIERAIETLAEFRGRPEAVPVIREALGLPALVTG